MELFEKSDILFRFMNFYGFLDMLEHNRLLLTVDVETREKDGLHIIGGFFSSFSRTTLSSHVPKTFWRCNNPMNGKIHSLPFQIFSITQSETDSKLMDFHNFARKTTDSTIF